MIQVAVSGGMGRLGSVIAKAVSNNTADLTGLHRSLIK